LVKLSSPLLLTPGLSGSWAYDEHQGVLHAIPLPDGRYESLHPRCPHPPGTVIYERVEIGHYSSSLKPIFRRALDFLSSLLSPELLILTLLPLGVASPDR
jgi:hypothetical protein